LHGRFSVLTFILAWYHGSPLRVADPVLGDKCEKLVEGNVFLEVR
jgi:hypothetical protein